MLGNIEVGKPIGGLSHKEIVKGFFVLVDFGEKCYGVKSEVKDFELCKMLYRLAKFDPDFKAVLMDVAKLVAADLLAEMDKEAFQAANN